ncbi:hypothetical protein [Devosia aurantiaca]|uniref:hypothetical protein n=1 Tax=Devosia aurantiaca TaxID=2714858 RepID=UPI001F42A994|nr:hypothetical protein [Devosia aurantiaca]
MTDLPGRRPPPTPDSTPTFRERLENLRHLGRLVAQIWRTSRPLTAASIGLRVVAAFQPVAVLYAAKLIVDEVVRLTALEAPGPSILDWWNAGLLEHMLLLLLFEFALVLANDVIARVTGLVDSILSELHSIRSASNSWPTRPSSTSCISNRQNIRTASSVPAARPPVAMRSSARCSARRRTS